jgi:hypothetical protein
MNANALGVAMKDILQKLLDDPKTFIDGNVNDGFEVPGDELEEYYLLAARKKFDAVRDRVPALKRLAAEQSVDIINSLDDLVKVLFPHTVYKSYPLSYLENNRFQKLTRWLNGLTSVDLRHVDASECQSIDEWLELLDNNTDLRVVHSSGTTGKLSFLPRTQDLSFAANYLIGNLIRDWFGDNSGPDMVKDPLPLLFPSYKSGYQTMVRTTEAQVEIFGITEDNCLYLYNDHMSSDIASLAGRIRAAEARGELGSLKISPALLAKKDEIIEREKMKQDSVRKFFDEAVSRFGGKQVYINTVWTMLFDPASKAKSLGFSNLFAADSVLITGGGNKGYDLPEGWKEMIFDVLGFDRAYEMFGMSEMTSPCMLCDHKNYHIAPVVIPFALDPISGEALPRSGAQTGRYAFLDLMPETYWGGFISGDEVTLSGFDNVCPCGRKGAYLGPEIRRYSAKEGGDDKINCAGAPEAHDKALEYLIKASA